MSTIKTECSKWTQSKKTQRPSLSNYVKSTNKATNYRYNTNEKYEKIQKQSQMYAVDGLQQVLQHFLAFHS